MHAEIMSDLTSNEFIVPLERFVIRREISNEISSDNGTTFVVANKIVQKLSREKITIGRYTKGH